MQRISLNDDLSISRIVYGMWRINDCDTSPAHVVKKIQACLDQGITTIDQADIYGDYTAEKTLGVALAHDPSLRSQIEIITKCDIIAPVGRYSDKRVKYYDTSAPHIQSSVDMSLKAMGIDYIDLLLIHRPDPFMDHHETGATLDALVSSGKIRTVGVSNFKPHDWTLLSSAMKTPLVTNQIEISVMANTGFTNGDIAFLQERSISPMAWSPLGGGALFSDKNAPLFTTLEAFAEAHDVDVGTIATAWLLAHPANIIPVMGTNKIERINHFHKALNIKLDRQDWFEIYEKANGQEVP